MSVEFAAIAEKLIGIAGLSDLVTVVVGPAEDSLRKLKGEGKLTGVDMLFLDHAEELYVSDFKVWILSHFSLNLNVTAALRTFNFLNRTILT
jgi:predicted O-methyltransferase YrrM